MGYCMEQRKACFTIKHENFDKVLEAIKAIPQRDYAWVNNYDYADADSLVMAMRAWRWDVGFEKDNVLGDIICIYFTGEKFGDDEVLFRAIAPYVEDGSYIEMQGEEGELWRWVFKDGQCKNFTPRVDWTEASLKTSWEE